MYLTGLTLEAQGMVAASEERSFLILEILCPYPGIQDKMRDWLNAGQPRICDIGWIGDKLFLSLRHENDDLESLKTNWLVNNVGAYANLVATVFGWEPQNQKNGVTEL
jgi:hypothetical protein